MSSFITGDIRKLIFSQASELENVRLLACVSSAILRELNKTIALHVQILVILIGAPGGYSRETHSKHKLVTENAVERCRPLVRSQRWAPDVPPPTKTS